MVVPPAKVFIAINFILLKNLQKYKFNLYFSHTLILILVVHRHYAIEDAKKDTNSCPQTL